MRASGPMCQGKLLIGASTRLCCDSLALLPFLCSWTQSRPRSFPRQGWDQSNSLPQPKGGVSPARSQQQGWAQRCQLAVHGPPSLARPSRAPEWEGSGSPARRARGGVLAGKLKGQGRVEHSFVWKDDAGQPCNVGIMR